MANNRNDRGPGQRRDRNSYSNRNTRNDRRVRNVSTVIALIMLLAIVSPIFFTCIQQQGVQSYAPLEHNAYAASSDNIQHVGQVATTVWSDVATGVAAANAAPNNTSSLPAAPTATAAPVFVPPTASQPAPTSSVPTNTLYIPETGHFLKGPFLNFWQKNGSFNVFGYPLSEAFEQNGVQMQLFDQALLEYHPELQGQPGEVQLGFLGQQLAAAQGLVASNAAFAPVAAVTNTANQRYFAETKHTLSAGFKNFWEQNGLLKFLGYPISQELNQDGLTVQYFQRGRLEYDSTSHQINYSNAGDLLIAAQKWPQPAIFNFETNLSGSQIGQGGLIAIKLWNDNNVQPQNLQGTFGSDKLRFGQVGTMLEAFEPITPSIQPAPYKLDVSFTDQNGNFRWFNQTVTVTTTDFGTQDLTLQGNLQSLADHKADDYDDAKLAYVYNAYSSQPLWNNIWQWPLTVPWTLTTNFGQRRTYNGQVDTLYYHGGLDMAPNTGTEGEQIYAPAAGKVVFVGPLEARGNTVAIDHGMGVTSYYFHLSQFNVKVGQTVQLGDVLGLVGTTGRATGPHLHWEVRVNGIITDPRTFIKQDLLKK